MLNVLVCAPLLQRAIPKGVPQRPEFEVPSDKTEAESPRLMGGCLEADQGLPVLDDEVNAPYVLGHLASHALTPVCLCPD